jgi:hypothetical protein
MDDFNAKGEVPDSETLVQIILAEINDFIDPPMVTGIGIAPSERLWLAQCIAKRIQEGFRP